MDPFLLFIISYLTVYVILRSMKIKNIILTSHQTGQIEFLALYNLLFAVLLQIYSVYNNVFLFSYIFYCFIFFSVYELIWTVVGRPGLREQMGRGEVMGQLIHFGLIFLPYSFTAGNEFASQLFHYFFSSSHFVMPFIFLLQKMDTFTGKVFIVQYCL